MVTCTSFLSPRTRDQWRRFDGRSEIDVLHRNRWTKRDYQSRERRNNPWLGIVSHPCEHGEILCGSPRKREVTTTSKTCRRTWLEWSEYEQDNIQRYMYVQRENFYWRESFWAITYLSLINRRRRRDRLRVSSSESNRREWRVFTWLVTVRLTSPAATVFSALKDKRNRSRHSWYSVVIFRSNSRRRWPFVYRP